MQIQTIVEYRGTSYESMVSDELSEKQLKEVTNTIKLIVKGKCSFLVIETSDGHQYFPKKVLEECIIKIYHCR